MHGFLSPLSLSLSLPVSVLSGYLARRTQTQPHSHLGERVSTRNHQQRRRGVKHQVDTEMNEAESDSDSEADERPIPPPSTPFLPTPMCVVREILDVGCVGPSDVVCDIGCGDGRMAIVAWKEYGVKQAMGIEANKQIYIKAVQAREEQGCPADRVELFHSDFTQSNNPIIQQCLDRQ